MPTNAELIGEIRSWLDGNSAHVDRATTLLSNVTDSGAQTIHVTSAANVSPGGQIEIQSELLYVESINYSINMLTVPAWGRGQQGSIADAHGSGEKVTANPAWPQARIFATTNEVLVGLYPQLFGVFTDETNVADPTRYAYPLPAKCRRVIDIRVKDPAIPGAWRPVNCWRLDPSADVTDFPTRVAVEIRDGMPPGQTVKVVYEAEPQPFTGPEDEDFATVTGLPSSAAAAVALGVGAVLIESLELTRLRQTTVEQQERSATVLAGSASNASKYLYAGLFQERVSKERDKLLARYPVRVRKSW